MQTILFVDFEGLDNNLANQISDKYNVIFVHNIKKVDITDKIKKIKYINIEHLHSMNSNPNAVFIRRHMKFINQFRMMFPYAKIIVYDLQTFETDIGLEISYTILGDENLRKMLYEKTMINADVRSEKEILEYISKPYTQDITKSIKTENMKILMIKRTKLAHAPDELAKAINKYTEHKADVDCVPKEGYDILHYHNIYIPAVHKRKIIQFHSEPKNVTRKQHFQNIIPKMHYPDTELVISQYHATLPEYNACKIVKNVINFEETLYNIKPFNSEGKITIGYSPSTLKKVNEFYDKGYEQTKEILVRLSQKLPIKIVIITNRPLEECISLKSECDILIDECVTGSFHRSGLEGLALGKVTICWLNDKVEKLIRGLGDGTVPFVNIDINSLEETLIKLCNLPKQALYSSGLRNREWMEKNWHPKKIAQEFIKIYQNLPIN